MLRRAVGVGALGSRRRAVSVVGAVAARSSPWEFSDSVAARSGPWEWRKRRMMSSDAAAVDSSEKTVSALVDPLASTLGWGPIDLCTYGIDYFHNVGGLPWWASIVAMTTLFRVGVFPLNVTQQRNALRMKTLQPELQAVQENMKMNPPQSPEETRAYQMKMQQLQEKHGVNFFATLLGPLAQIPIFLTMFWTLRDMSEKYPSFTEGGTLWFTDLAVPDATYGLPVFCGASFLLMTEISLKESPQADPSKQQMMKNVMRGMGLMMLPITATMPSAVAVYWTTTNVFSIFQSALLRIPVVKDFFDIKLLVDPAAYPSAQSAAHQPYADGEQPELFRGPPRQAGAKKRSRKTRRELRKP